MPRIKICCIASPEEAAAAVAAGAAALGLVAEMPSGPGPIPDERISQIAARVPPGVSRFLLTARTTADAIADHIERCGVDTVQLVDTVEPAERAALRRLRPEVRVVQVVHVEGGDALDQARADAEHSDAVLLDSGRPSLPVPELGGTGRTHDWSVSARIVETLSIPVYLAGGLNAANARAAISAVRPFGLDVCSGVRTEDRLDKLKLAAFMEAASIGN
ncbi:MAG: phosphoribosylanthranilate isomerase [Planctomycetota bacterium]